MIPTNRLVNNPTSQIKNKNFLILNFKALQKAFYIQFFYLYNKYTYTDKLGGYDEKL